MQQEKITLDELTLVGLTTRTHNKNEMNPETAKIGGLFNAYLEKQIANQFKNRTTPGIIYAAYTEYESDENGEYTYFLGEAVDSLEGQDLSQFSSLVIPTGDFQKFTTPPGAMPGVVIAAWQAIWQMQTSDLDGERCYIADFEVYDQRASDPSHTVIDIYIGIR